MAQVVAPEGVSAVFYEGLGSLPHFNPDNDTEPLHPAVVALRTRVDAADALLFSVPEYMGGLPGTFKNLLDWVVGGAKQGIPVAWINASALPTNAADAHHSLRTILGRLSTDIIEAACVHIPVRHSDVDSDGRIADPTIGQQLAGVLEIIARYVKEKADQEL